MIESKTHWFRHLAWLAACSMHHQETDDKLFPPLVDGPARQFQKSRLKYVVLHEQAFGGHSKSVTSLSSLPVKCFNGDS